MVAIASLIFILFLSLIVVRVAAVALTLTGMARDVARFQARSAWTGTGFTTAESEQVVNHPVRREIISFLILLRNAGFVTAASALVLSFVSVEGNQQGGVRILVLICGVVALWFVARSKWIDAKMSRVIAWALKRFSSLDTRDYADLLHLAGDYAIKQLRVNERDWLANRTLQELALPDEGILVLGVTRPGGHYEGAPDGDTIVHGGDTLLIYGRSTTIDNLDKRQTGLEGDRERAASVQEQAEVSEQERAENPAGSVATG